MREPPTRRNERQISPKMARFGPGREFGPTRAYTPSELKLRGPERPPGEGPGRPVPTEMDPNGSGRIGPDRAVAPNDERAGTATRMGPEGAKWLR